MVVDFEGFINVTNARSSLKGNEDAEKVYKWLRDATNVVKMMTLADLGIAPLNAVVKELEQKLLESKEFSIKDITNRQDIGRMITFILLDYGYTATNERESLRFFSGARYFKQGKVYKKTRRGNMMVDCKVKEAVELEDKIKLYRENVENPKYQAYRITFGGELVDIGMRVTSIEPVSYTAIDEDMLQDGNMYIYEDDGKGKYENQVSTWIETDWVDDEEDGEMMSAIIVLNTEDGQLKDWMIKALEEKRLLITPILGW